MHQQQQQHSTNVVIQTGPGKKSAHNETDLQKAITDYQTKVHSKKMSGKNKSYTGRSANKNI